MQYFNTVAQFLIIKQKQLRKNSVMNQNLSFDLSFLKNRKLRKFTFLQEGQVNIALSIISNSSVIAF